MTPLGIWIDTTPESAIRELEELPGLGISTVAIMVESSSPGWDPSWTVDQVARACERARSLDLEVVLTTWPAPRRSHIDAMAAWLERAVPSGAAAIEVDLEGQWRRDRLDGTMASLGEAAALLLLRLRSLAGAHDLRLELTTHCGHQETSPSALVAPHVDRVVAQAHSIRERPGGQIVEWDDRRLGPGHHQTWAAADARTAPGVGAGVGLSLGLPLWGQRWPGHDPAEALELAYQAALAEAPREIRFWSSKHLRNAYARRWLEDCALPDSPVKTSYSSAAHHAAST